MANVTSPNRFSGDGGFYDMDAENDICSKMRVPKRIRVAGNTGDSDYYNSDVQRESTIGNESLNMHVPDRILVAGGDKHIGVKEPLREMKLENAVMPPDPGMVRVKTPPRSITLDEHYFPPADEFPPPSGQNQFYGYNAHEDHDIIVTPGRPGRTPRNFKLAARELTPGPTEGLSVTEEVFHLRRQVAKLHRRIMSIEMDNQQRQQRETIIRTIGAAYFVIKALLWLYRST